MGKMDRQYHATQSQASLNPGEDGNAVCLCVFLFVASIFHNQKQTIKFSIARSFPTMVAV
jgi:hypothetical protein